MMKAIDHKVELTCDFREFYNLSLNEAGETYSFEEALILIEGLSTKVQSLYFTKINKLRFPVTRGDTLLTDIYNLLLVANSQEKVTEFYQPDPRQIEKPKTEKTLMTMEEIGKRFTPVVSTLTPEEIKEKNKKFIEKHKTT